MSIVYENQIFSIDCNKKTSVRSFYLNTKNKASLNICKIKKCPLVYFSKKGFFKLFKKGSYDNTLLKKVEEKEDEFINISDSIIFQEGKYCVLQTEENFVLAINHLEKVFIKPLIFVSAIGAILGLIRSSFLLTFGSTLFMLFFARMKYGINQNKRHLIIKLELMENGNECLVTTLHQTFKVDNKKIRKLQLEEGMFLSKNIENMRKNYIPLSIDSRLYLIPLISSVNSQNVLAAISDGKYIIFGHQVTLENSIEINEENKESQRSNKNHNAKKEKQIDI